MFASINSKHLWSIICLVAFGFGMSIVSRGDAQEAVKGPPNDDSASCGTLDQVWLVSTRQTPACCISDQFQISVFDGCQFLATSFEHLLNEFQTEPHRPTVFYIHGYRTDLNYSQYRGLQVYGNSLACVSNRIGVRYIIWSWATETDSCLPRDFKRKSDHSVVEGHRLSHFMQQAGVQNGIIIGYSMGAQVALTNLVDLGNLNSSTSAWHLILVAPVLAPQSCCDVGRREFDQVIQSATLLTNSTDRALKSAQRLNRLSHRSVVDQRSLPSALSLSGHKLTVWETSCEVGSRHNIDLYSQTTAFRATMAELLQIQSAQVVLDE
ncbi:MAG: alpha/beta hydrolase [Pirellulaceae bacterium]|nr:alpha/beta hydrolase [Pirellulaceae bacterium]